MKGSLLKKIGLVAAFCSLISSSAFASIKKPAEVRGIYLTAQTAANQKRVEGLVKNFDSKLNSVVIDVKESYGKYNKLCPLPSSPKFNKWEILCLEATNDNIDTIIRMTE